MEAARRSIQYPAIINNKPIVLDIDREAEENTLFWLKQQIEENQKLPWLDVYSAECPNLPLDLLKSISYYDSLSPLIFVAGKDITITVNTLNHEKIQLIVDAETTGEQVKILLSYKLRIPVSQQSLSYRKKKIENNQTIGSHNIKSGDTLCMIPALYGGGGALGLPFADLDDPSKLHTIQFSSTAPLYRMVVNGLNIEGKCKSKRCLAYGKMVICMIGYGIFDLIADVSSVRCPVCKERMEPETCGFYDCYYRFKGTKMKRGGEPKDCNDNEHKAEGEQYFRFEPNKEGDETFWTKLKIIAKETSTAKTCRCCSKVCSEKELPCGHAYHAKCLTDFGIASGTCYACSGPKAEMPSKISYKLTIRNDISIA